MITINAACATLGTPIFGYIVDRTGSYATAWQVLGFFLTFGTIWTKHVAQGSAALTQAEDSKRSNTCRN
jgi:hypothetical protein